MVRVVGKEGALGGEGIRIETAAWMALKRKRNDIKCAWKCLLLCWQISTLGRPICNVFFF